jgi:transcription antitermination factor NusG
MDDHEEESSSSDEVQLVMSRKSGTLDDTLKWFALAVKPRFDKAVARALDVKGYETLLPLYKNNHKYGTRSKEFALPLFPGYVCCRFDPQIRRPILTTPGVLHVVGAGSVPVPLSHVEVNSLKTAIKAGIPCQPFPFLTAGQRVRISNGILAGVEGIVLRSKPYLRLVLSITLLQRSVLLEIDRDQVSGERTPHSNGALWRRPDGASSDPSQQS